MVKVSDLPEACVMKRVNFGIFAAACLLILKHALAGPLDMPTGTNLRRTVTVEVAEKTKDAVVYILTRKMVTVREAPSDPFLRAFPQFGQVRRQEGTLLGSGFIVHSDGYVVTNHHVIDSARKIEVQLLDGRKLPADIISSNPDADLAILRIHSDKPLPAIELGDSSDLMI